MKKKKQIVTIAIIALLAALLIAGAVYAYLTATSARSRVFTSGAVKGTLHGITEVSATDVYPTQEFEAAPKVKVNTDSKDAIAFIEVTIPRIAGISIYDSSGQLDANANGVMFEVPEANTANWILINGNQSIDSSADSVTYVYGYKTKLSAGDVTSTAAFNKLTAANFAENNALAGTLGTVTITADLIQADGLKDGSTLIESPYDATELAAAYAKFNNERSAASIFQPTTD